MNYEQKYLKYKAKYLALKQQTGGNSKKMKTDVILKPFLIYEGNDFQNMYTGNKEIDKLLEERIKKDYIKVAKGIFFGYTTKKYKYDKKKNLIELTIEHKKPIDEKEMTQYINEDGPDTWMEGNIIILDKEEAKKTSYYKGKEANPIEMGVSLVKFKKKR